MRNIEFVGYFFFYFLACVLSVAHVRFSSGCGDMVIDTGVWMVLAFGVDRTCRRCVKNILASSSEFVFFCYCYKPTQYVLL